MASGAIREMVVANEKQRAEAREFVKRLEDSMRGSRSEANLPGDPGLSRDFTRFLASLLDQISQGKTVVVGALPKQLTTTVAAAQLGVSRMTLMKLVREGTLPAHKVGTHTRLLTEDVLAFRRKRLTEQRSALRDLLDLEDELDVQ
jgi:excisionase family DNA binding protein